MDINEVLVVAIPKSASPPELWKGLALRLKEFRLLSLQRSPECFSSSYEREFQFQDQQWEDRLSNPVATTFVALPMQDIELVKTQALNRLLTEDWRGTLVLCGPSEQQATEVHTDDGVVSVEPSTPLSGEVSSHFMLNAMYVLPNARGQGIAVKLVKAAIKFASMQHQKSGNGKVRITLVVDYPNIPARNLYEKCGFKTIHRYWFKDAMTQEPREAALMELWIDSMTAVGNEE